MTIFATSFINILNKLGLMTNDFRINKTTFSLPVRLRKRRKQLRLSQEALGVEIGLDLLSSRSRISRYETGTHEPNMQTAKKLADTLRVPLEFLYCERDSVAELVLAVSKLTDQEVQALTTFLVTKQSSNTATSEIQRSQASPQ